MPLTGAGQPWRPWCVPPSWPLPGLSQAHCPFTSDADAGLWGPTGRWHGAQAGLLCVPGLPRMGLEHSSEGRGEDPEGA